MWQAKQASQAKHGWGRRSGARMPGKKLQYCNQREVNIGQNAQGKITIL